MKICIIGPVHTTSYYGGVALFDEELAIGFAKCNCDVVIATYQKNAEEKQLCDRVWIRRFNKYSFSKYLSHNEPDIIIASLGYAALLPKKKLQAAKIYFLHGFFNERFYGRIKAALAVLYQRYLIKRYDYVFANSYFTRMINREFFGIESDKVLHLGVSEEVFEKASKAELREKERGSVFFAGRLVEVKGTRALVEAAKTLADRGIKCSFQIAGDGPDYEWMQSEIREYGLQMQLLGRVSQTDIADYYQKSEVFVSLCPTESFGITYIEALMNGCKIVCPKTGGQIEYLLNMTDRVAFVAEDSATEIADGIQRLFEQEGIYEIPYEEKNGFRYAYVAQEVLNFVSNQRNK